MAHQEQVAFAVFALGIVFFITLVALVSLRSWTNRALVEFAVGITKLDGNLTNLFLLMLDGVNTRNCKNEG